MKIQKAGKIITNNLTYFPDYHRLHCLKRQDSRKGNL